MMSFRSRTPYLAWSAASRPLELSFAQNRTNQLNDNGEGPRRHKIPTKDREGNGALARATFPLGDDEVDCRWREPFAPRERPPSAGQHDSSHTVPGSIGFYSEALATRPATAEAPFSVPFPKASASVGKPRTTAPPPPTW